MHWLVRWRRQRLEDARALGWGDGREGLTHERLAWRGSPRQWVYDEFYDRGRSDRRQEFIAS